MNRKLLHWTRTLHIYLTMAALALMLFFAITGITANHEEWFGATAPHERTATGTTPADAVARGDKLQIVEHLRSKFGVDGALFSFDADSDQYVVTFKGPGRSAVATILRTPAPPEDNPASAAKPVGDTKVEFRTFNLIARLNDLHRARDTGDTWRVLVDLSAVMIILACVTGVMLWTVLPKRRKYGTAYAVLGVVASLAFYFWVVP